MTAPEGHVPVPGSEREPLAGARRVSAVAPDERVDVTVIVREGGGGQRLDAVGDFGAQAAGARHYLTPEEFAARHGAGDADLELVEEFAADHDLTVIERSAARRTVVLSGTAQAMSVAFGVTLDRYEHPGGTYRGRTGPVHVPQELADVVVAVLGLDDRPAAQPRLRVGIAPGDQAVDPRAAAAAFTPPELARLYEFPPTADGKGQCIAIIELGGGYRRADLKTYFHGLAVPLPRVSAISVDGAHNTPTGDPNSADGEVALDIEVAGAIAPGARIAVYFAPNTDRGFLDAITKALHDTHRRPSVISISWGAAESDWTAQSMQAFDDAFATAAALGVTIFVAAGDDGSNDRVGDGKAHADFPASSPHVSGCGGTRLDAANGAIVDEVVWNEASGGATGGGVSDTFALPSWQTGAGVPPSANGGGQTGRGVPDVAAVADPATGYQVLVDGKQGVFGGTSAVAPLMAGLVALLNERSGTRVGFLNPLLYGGVGSGGAFRDITSGDNGAYHAGSGWDACTGFGSPIGTALESALAAATSAAGAGRSAPGG